MKNLNKKIVKNISVEMFYQNISTKSKGFTLVELIIVITILAILATIAFISFQGYSKNARDGNRLTALRNIKSGLEIYYTQTGNYPDTESGTLIQSSGGLTTLGTQGYFGDTNSRLLKFSKTPTDPYDGTKYIYSVNLQKNKYQIMGFLETSDYLSLINNTYAADYSTRTTKTLGDNLGILLDADNNPIGGTGIDVENYTGGLKAVFSDSYNISGTGVILKGIKSTFKDGKQPWTYYDAKCDLPDIVVGNQVWAGCNSTLGSGFEWGQTDANIGTNVYSGTISNCFNYAGTSLTISTYCSAGTSSMMSNAKESNWNGNTTSVPGTVNNIWGKFYTWTNLSTNCKGGDFASSTSNNNCPCPSGWHIPTDAEWITLENSLGCTDSLVDGNWRCGGLGWMNNSSKNSNNNIIQALKIPLAGSRSSDGFSFVVSGANGRLWSSSGNNSNAYVRFIDWSLDAVYRNKFNSTNGLKVRCIKD